MKVILFFTSLISFIVGYFTGIYYSKEQIADMINPVQLIRKF